jgi:hypothetical protein
MRKIYLFSAIIFTLFLQNILAQHTTYYEILDAAEANKLYNGLKTGTTHTTKWPIPVGRVLVSELTALGWDHYNDLVTIEYIELSENETLVKAKIRIINLDAQNLSGMVPAVSLDSLFELSLSFNSISGVHPDIQLPNLRWLDLSFSKLKSFPPLPFPKLGSLRLDNCEMVGEIPHLAYDELTFFDIAENQLSGEINLDCPKLDYIGAEENKLSGSLLKINAPALRWLDIGSNKYEGTLDLKPSPMMQNLDIVDNKFDGIAAGLNNKLPSLTYFFCESNKFEFDDLEMFVGNVGTSFSYSPQEPKALVIEKGMEKQKLTAKVGGSQNKYQWYYIPIGSLLRQINPDSIGLYMSFYLSWTNPDDFFEALDKTNNYIEIGLNENPIYYGCLITNNQLPNLKLASVVLNAQPNNCWETPYFSFCFIEDDAQWGSGDGDNEITAAKPLSINDLIHFEGTLTIDTTILSMKTEGKFFIKDIPLPGGGSGNFTLANGTYELSLGGENGKLTGFINDALSTFTPNIGGLDLKLEDLQLIGGQSAQGVSLTLQISWDNITPSCGSGLDQTTAIKLDGLKIMKGLGISVDGMNVSDMGIAPGFCLKELNASYDQDKDKLAFGLTLLTPFIEVGGGLGLIGGEIDSVSMKAVLQENIIPLGATGVGIIGCEGRVNKITDPPVSAKFGGIISAVVSDNIFQLTTSIEYIPPSELKIELGDGKFFNPPYADGWWLGEGGVYGQIDLKTYRVKLGGEIKLSPYRDEDGKKQHMASGKIDLAYRKGANAGITVGQLEGVVTIPKLNNKWPYDWMNTKLGLPYNIGGDALILYRSSSKYITGNLNLGGRIGNVRYTIDLSKNYDEEGFFGFQAEELKALTNAYGREEVSMTVPENVPLAVMTIYGLGHSSSVSLTDPKGNVITSTQPGENAEWNINIDEGKGYWTLYEPIDGAWKVSNTETDSVSLYLFGDQYAFSLAAVPADDGVLVSWDKSIFSSEDKIDLFLDNDQAGMDGSWISEVGANQGNYLIPYEDIADYCSFYIFGIADRNGQIRPAYAADYIRNPLDAYSTPEYLDWSYDDITSELIIDWSSIDEINHAGFVLEYRKDTVVQTLAVLNPGETHFQDMVENFNPKNILFYSFGSDGQSSCPIYLEESSTAVDEVVADISTPEVAQPKIFPNPSSREITIAFDGYENKFIQIELINVVGQILIQENIIRPHNGINHYNLNVDNLFSGQFFIKVRGDKNTYPTVSMIKLE